jgi:mitochondrial fission protein ELM1
MTTNSTWILNESFALQAHAIRVARAVGFPIELKRVQASGLLRYLPMSLQKRMNPERLLSLDSLTAAPPRLVIAAGRRSVPVGLAIKRISPIPVFTLYVRRKSRRSSPDFDLVLTNHERSLTPVAEFDAIYTVTTGFSQIEQSFIQSGMEDVEIVARVIKNAMGLKSLEGEDVD